jgi:hypothetical protein
MWIRAGGGEVQTDLVGHGGDEGPTEVLGVKLTEGWSWARSSKPAGCGLRERWGGGELALLPRLLAGSRWWPSSVERPGCGAR